MKHKLKVLYSESQIQKVVKQLAKKIEKNYSVIKHPQPLVVISVLKGAFIFTADLIREINLPVQLEFVRISSYGTKKISSGKIEAPLLLLPDLSNRDILIVEDIVDSGKTIRFLREYFSAQFRPKSLKVACLLNKSARREVNIKADYIGFDVGDYFLVGYGLDNAEKFRHLPYLAIDG
ncbi:MAG: hypoxanthine phosphoribosyltransferase [Candidatus Melainabacteria bacterium RIFCSPLOWO2_02_FULL_35_15]|nr:MAG: hypoxanthine phosphoribosyltransferase [Candidatus Melainabacteria bacterium RIFCSPLOWO2_12_FULL_35_11]OGI13388.1 MAG: hypoxanthine phosphoribosyltransferase [Candidatus Melainabacteria bacterium RIFCSPLOWO2_02_FULL_35_15]